MDNKLLLIILLALIFGAGFFLISSSKPDPRQVDIGPEAIQLEKQRREGAMTATYTLDEVRAHDSTDDCWLAIHGKVYNVTGFEEKHGGGEAILEGCGLDATELFETRPMGSNTPHSEKARSFLPNFYIGDLAQ